jgi:DNA repair protein RecO (recombination protein O)
MRTAEPGAIWRAVTYFSLWAVRLAGFLPELDACSECGQEMERAFFTRFRNGLLCADCRRSAPSSWELDTQSLEIAKEMLRTPISQLGPRSWSQASTASLRRMLGQQIETHIERKLVTLKLLDDAA